MAPKLTTEIFIPVLPRVRYTGWGKTKGPDSARFCTASAREPPPSRADVVPTIPTFKNVLLFIPSDPFLFSMAISLTGILLVKSVQ
jgi:hypothetical protein